MDHPLTSLLDHWPHGLDRSRFLAAGLVLLGQMACDGKPGDTSSPDTQETSPDWVADPRCGVEGIPSDGVPLGMVSLGESEVATGETGGLFAAGDHNGDGCADIAFATTGEEFDGHAGTTHIFSGPGYGDIDIENDSSAKLVGEPNDWAYHPFTGDVNGDGADDWMIAGHDINGEVGEVYVALGPVSNSMELGSEAHAVLLAQDDMTGSEDQEAADLNDDGIDDLIIGALNYTEDEVHRGGVYIVYGPVPAGDSQLRDADAIVHSGDEYVGLGHQVSA